MVKAGTWGKNAIQLHSFFGWKKIDAPFSNPFYIKAEDCYLDEFSSYGKIDISKEDSENHPEWMCDFGSLEWNLKIHKKIAFNVGFGAEKLFRKLQLFEMFWHAEGMKTCFEGEIIFNGEKYIVQNEKSFWHVEQKTWTNKMITDVTCKKEDMLLVNYEAPNGKKLHNKLWNGGNGKGTVKLYHKNKLIDEIECKNVGCEYGTFDGEKW